MFLFFCSKVSAKVTISCDFELKSGELIFGIHAYHMVPNRFRIKNEILSQPNEFQGRHVERIAYNPIKIYDLQVHTHTRSFVLSLSLCVFLCVCVLPAFTRYTKYEI